MRIDRSVSLLLLDRLYLAFNSHAQRNDTKLLEADITRIKQRYEKRKQELRSLEERVENLRRKVGEQPPSEDTSRIDAEIVSLDSASLCKIDWHTLQRRASKAN